MNAGIKKKIFLPAVLFGCLVSSVTSCRDNTKGTDQAFKIDTSNAFQKATKSTDNTRAWVAPDTATIPDNNSGKLIRYGKQLIANTAKYLGPGGSVSHSSNGMNCQNCHLDAGTKLYANSFSAVYSNYPKFRGRSGSIEHLEKRINDCMERSLNGRVLDSLSMEMTAIKAYINWVGKDVRKGVTPKGASVVELPYLERAADRTKGRIMFQKLCISCHGNDGQGRFNQDGITYLYPPLWGSHSYNTAAGMYRLSRIAGFIKSNMPFVLSNYGKPVLSDEESWDVAAYINSMPRPEKKFKADWPNISKKPPDFPFGPYSDHFSENQHKLGPFKEIIEARKKE